MEAWDFEFKKAGKRASTLEQLVDLCVRYRDEASEYLYMTGLPLQKWMLHLAERESENRDEADQYRNLAREIWSINGEYSNNRSTGLEKFLEAAETVLHPQFDRPRPDLTLARMVEEMRRSARTSDWNATRDAANRILAIDRAHAEALEWKATSERQIEIAVLLKKASELWAQGNFPLAGETYKKVILLDPRNSRAAARLEQVKEKETQAKIACLSLVIGTVLGGLFIYFTRQVIVSLWLRIYLGFLVMGLAGGLVGVPTHEKKMQALLSTVLSPLGKLAVLFGSYVLWQNWLASVVAALFIGHFISLQIQATFYFEFYKTSTSTIANAYQQIQAAMSQAATGRSQ